MKVLKLWTALLIVLAASVFTTPLARPNLRNSVPPVTSPSASTGPVYQVSLDANSLSQTDVSVATNASKAKSFRIGAVINGSTTNPLTGVWGWQFSINYNATAFIPQGDPSATSLYPDGAASTVLFGALTAANWDGNINSGCAFGSSSINPPADHVGEITVFFTFLKSGTCPTSISLSTNSLLANVAFEILPGASPGVSPATQSFTISNVIFVDSTGSVITGPIAGADATETINDIPPVANITVTPLRNGDSSCVIVTGSPCTAYAFTFDGSASTSASGSIANPGGYFWDFGDGTQDLGVTGVVVTHDYGVAAGFVVTLRVQDAQGATGAARDSLGGAIMNGQPSHAKTIAGSDLPPIASFTFQSNNAQPLLVNFNGSNSTDPDGTVTAYIWSFGDGSPNPFNQAYTSHLYSQKGNYTVTLTVVDNANLTDTVSHVVPVAVTDKPPVAILTWERPVFTEPNPAAGLAVDITGSQSYDPDGYIQSWYWTLGDGAIDYKPQIFHSYANPGDYLVTLTVSDNAGLSATANATISAINDTSPYATFTFTPANPLVGQEVSFNGSSSFDPDGFIQSASWTFGDGYNGSGLIVTHNYSSEGTYVVRLTVFDNRGLPTLAGATVLVMPVSSDIPPTAAFYGSDINPPVGQTVFFDGSRSYDPDGYIVSWSWSFGDGSTGFGPQVSHAYSSPGNFDVNLTVYDNSGSSAHVIATLTVSADLPPIAVFRFTPAAPRVQQQAFFDGNSSYDPDGYIKSWLWSFGDGFQSYGPQVQHSYKSAGNYTVSLTVTDNNGLTATTTMIVPVLPKPLHDVAIVYLNTFPHAVVSTESVGVNVGLTNNGSSNETVSVAAYYGPNVIGTLKGIFLPAPVCYYCSYTLIVQIVWDTTEVSAGNYTISATVFLPTDENPSDDTITDGQVQVLPPPILVVTPLSGPPGRTVVVHGSGFPAITPYYRGGIGFVEVTFDDQLIGFTNSYEGQFNFTFSIPFSQQGPHLIKALDEINGAHANVGFQVLAQPTGVNLAVTIQVGSVYFLSDTAIIYAQVTLNGQPTNPSSLQLQIFLPNGSSRILTTQPVGPGLFKASYAVPKSGSLGTYFVLGKAHTSMPLDASAITSFEVKQSWLSKGGPAIATGGTLAALLSLVAVAWRRGYFKKEDYETPSTFLLQQLTIS